MADPASIPAPNYTQTPNVIFDLMADKDAHLTEAELRVILVIARKTFGWHKKRDKISLSQLEQLTAMSRTSVIAGLDAAIARGLVRKTPDRNDKRGGFFYELVVEEPNDQTSTKSGLVQNLNQSSKLTRTSPKSELELVQNLDTQKKEKEKKEGVRENPVTPTPPAVEVYARLTERQPTNVDLEFIQEVTNLVKWERAIKDWLASGYKPGNVKGILDWYHGRGRHQQNGQRPAENRPSLTVKPFVPDADAVKRENLKDVLAKIEQERR